MIRFNSVSKSYSKNIFVFKDLNFSIQKGSFTLVTGPSGSGKTSLLNLIAGFDRPSSGSIKSFGFDLNSLTYRQLYKYRKKIGFVFQDFKLIKDQKVHEHLKFALKIKNPNASEKSMEDLLDQFHLKNKMHSYVQNLSEGEKQRLCLIRASLGEPEILILDEPTRNLEENASQKILEFLDELYKKNVTTILATHQKRIIDSLDCEKIELGK